MQSRSYFLGIDVGGSKSHALIANAQGEAVGFGPGGPGNWEGVGYDGLTRVLIQIVNQALEMAQIGIDQIGGAGMGAGGFDWPCQREDHLQAIAPVGLSCPVEVVNDATLGIWAGTTEGWGVSVVAGSGCNVRALSRDRQREGRMVGGASHWSGEWVGGSGVVLRALREVTHEWNKRGPATGLSQAFIQRFGAKDLNDLVEGLYLGRYYPNGRDALLVFRVAADGDEGALNVVRAAGKELGEMACGAIRQAGLENESFEVVLIGSLHNGHPLMAESMRETIQRVAPGARLVRLNAPPVIGGVVLGMSLAGLETRLLRQKVLDSAKQFFQQIQSES